MTTTNELYSPTSACFISNLYTLTGDKNLRCYKFTCNQGEMLVQVGANNLVCKDSDI